VARYAIARLFDYSKTLEAEVTCRNCDCKEETECTKNCIERHYEARIAGLEPMNFITFATPHLGSRGRGQVALSFLGTVLYHVSAPWIYHTPTFILAFIRHLIFFLSLLLLFAEFHQSHLCILVG